MTILVRVYPSVLNCVPAAARERRPPGRRRRGQKDTGYHPGEIYYTFLYTQYDQKGPGEQFNRNFQTEVFPEFVYVLHPRFVPKFVNGCRIVLDNIKILVHLVCAP